MARRPVLLLSFACSQALLSLAAGAAASPPKAALFSDDLPGFNQALAREITAQVQASGYAAESIRTSDLTNSSLLTVSRYNLLVLPGARSLPMAAAPAIENYLRHGGHLLAVGLPAWQSPLFPTKGKWISLQTYEATVAAQLPQQIIEDFKHADLQAWSRAAGDATGKARYEVADTGHGKALHAIVEHLGGWDTLASPALAHPFPANHTLTCFRAKGGPHTKQLALEWREHNGSRWIATVDLTPDWKNYSLSPRAFKPWPTWPPGHTPKGQFQPQNAVGFSVGLAMSHTALEGDQHEYWFGALGTAPNPFGDELPPTESQVPVLESVCPTYQCFPITTPAVVLLDYQKAALEDWERPPSPAHPEKNCKPHSLDFSSRIPQDQPSPSLPSDFGFRISDSGFVALHPRPRGIGFAQHRPFRWEPLLAAYDASTQDYRGALGALVVNLDAPFCGSVWAVFTPQEIEFYRQPLVVSCLRQTLSRMKRGIFLAEGGAEFFTLFADQQFKAGARAVNFGRETVSNLSVSISFLDAKGANQRTVLENRIHLTAGETRTLEQDGLARSADETTVSTTISQGTATIDALRHELGVWEPTTRPQFIETRDGRFWLAGRPWKAHGVNYMPSSGIGLAHLDLFEAWLGAGPYDPEVIERDLRRIKGMKLNAVSVFVYHDSLKSQHLLDFLRRCKALGLHVNQSLRPGTPMNFLWPQMKELIEFYKLAQNETVFAYDLAWEPSHGGYEEQQRAYAQPWNEWLFKRYGNLAAAEKAWSFSVSSSADTPHSPPRPAQMEAPSMLQLTTDGPWRKLVADYRLFLDDQLRDHYAAARRLVKSIDPHHAISFRMSKAGDPMYNWDAAVPYDFYGLADAVDVWCPEAYGRIGDWDRVKAGAFTAAYARLCDPAKPLFWAEMGYSVWDSIRMAPDPHKLDWEATYYANFYRMMIQSGADGVFFWWYPGGFRRGEDSDFGIINPDGTDRPVTKVIRGLGPKFLNAPKPGKPDYWIRIDRDRDPRGLFGIYETAQAEFWNAISAAHRPGLKWEHKPGTSSTP